MSAALRSSLVAKPLTQSLSELESHYKDGSTINGEGMAIGPFGVFSSTQGSGAADSNQKSSVTASPESQRTSYTPQNFQSIESSNFVDGGLDWADIFELDFDSHAMMPLGVDDVLTDAYLPVLESPPADPMLELPDPSGSLQNLVDEQELNALSLLELSHTNMSPKELNPTDAQVLLKHFKDHVIAHLVSLPLGDKSAWEITILDSAVLTLSRLTYMTSQRVSRAALANLLALCAISANHLAAQNQRKKSGEVDYWQNFATRTIEIARNELQKSLRDETAGPNVAKYKDQLMAISIMLAFAVRIAMNIFYSVALTLMNRYNTNDLKMFVHLWSILSTYFAFADCQSAIFREKLDCFTTSTRGFE